MSDKKRMRPITVHLPERYLKYLERLVELGLYPSRSEAIRVAIRDLVMKELWVASGKKERGMIA